MTGQLCAECGAPDCVVLFDRLLSLEFSRVAPYAALHAATVSANGVQHPSRSPRAIREGQWRVLQLFHRRGSSGIAVFADRRRRQNAAGTLDAHMTEIDVPDMAALPPGPPVGRTIADVAGVDGKFPAVGHAERVTAWVASILNSDAR